MTITPPLPLLQSFTCDDEDPERYDDVRLGSYYVALVDEREREPEIRTLTNITQNHYCNSQTLLLLAQTQIIRQYYSLQCKLRSHSILIRQGDHGTPAAAPSHKIIIIP